MGDRAGGQGVEVGNRFRPGRGGRAVARARAGFGLVDVAVALFVLLAASGALLGVVGSALRVSGGSEETASAESAARATAEGLREIPFDQVFATYGPGKPSGFAVAGLEPRAGDADGLAGEIRFPVLPGGAGSELREDVLDPFLGMPCDLNGDGDVDDLDHALDYELLPVEIRVEWTGAAGPRSVRIGLLLGPDA